MMQSCQSHEDSHQGTMIRWLLGSPAGSPGPQFGSLELVAEAKRTLSKKCSILLPRASALCLHISLWFLFLLLNSIKKYLDNDPTKTLGYSSISSLHHHPNIIIHPTLSTRSTSIPLCLQSRTSSSPEHVFPSFFSSCISLTGF